MIKDIPFIEKWTQVNRGDILGSIWSSRNIDLKKKHGSVLTSPKLVVTTKSGVINNPTDLAVEFTQAIVTVGGLNSERYLTAAGKIAETLTTENAFQTDIGTPGAGLMDPSKDLIFAFNGGFYCVIDDTIYKRSGAVWPGFITDTLEDEKHLYAVYNDRVYITNDTTVYSMNTSDVLATTGSYTLDIQAANASNEDLFISCIRADSRGLWIGTSHAKNGRGKVFFWDGVTANTVEIERYIDGGSAMAMAIKDEVPYVLDERGYLMAYNGSYFEEVARFDLEDIDRDRFDNTQDNDRWIHPNGMQTIDGEILMAVNMKPNDTNDQQPIKHPSGIYAYNTDYGLYHKYSFTSQMDNTTVTDMGYPQIEAVGALYPLNNETNNDENDEISDFVVGYAYKEDNSTTRYVIAKNDKRGLDLDSASRTKASVITFTKWFSTEVQENWEKFYAFIKPLSNSTDKIVLKYRVQEHTPVDGDITWTEGDRFLTSDSVWDAVKTNLDLGIEYEFEGLSGEGAGYISKIVSMTGGSGVYEVVIGDIISGVQNGSTARCRVDRWVEVDDISDDEALESYVEFNPETSSTWIQFKLYMYGEDIELQRILSKSSTNQKA